MGYLWHVKNWFRVGKEFSWNLSFNTLAGFIGLSKYFQKGFFLKRADKKHEYILSLLEKEFAPLIEKYKTIPESTEKNKENIIWILWWQGLENAPPLVKACINSSINHKGNAKVIIITKDNINDYIEVPRYIVDLQSEGKMSMANMTDLIRVMLLSKYGGLWLDSTIFTSQDIPSNFFDLPFYSLHTQYEYNCYVQHNLYHIFILGSVPNGKLVSFVRDLFLEYWKKYDLIIDYFLLDYTLMVAYRNFPDIKAEIDNLPYSSERLYDLVHLLSKPYSDIEFEKLQKECMFSKLDWHKTYKTNVKGQKTYYSHIIQ